MKAPDNEGEKVPAIASRIKQLFDFKQLNASSAAKELGYSVPSKLYSILQGAAAPGYGTLTDMLAKWPDVSAEWLMMGRGGMLSDGAKELVSEPASQLRLVPFGKEEARPVLVGRPASAGAAGQTLTVTVGLDGLPNTMMVPVNAQAGYGLQHNEPLYVHQMGQYRIPGFERGTYRAFEVSGDSMEPMLHNRDVVVASHVSELRLLEPGEVYVVVTAENVLLKRIKHRLRSTDEEVTLYSDNPHRKPFGLETRDIIQLWQVQGYLSSYIPSAPDVTTERLWEVIEAMGLDKGEVKKRLDENATSDATLRNENAATRSVSG